MKDNLFDLLFPTSSLPYYPLDFNLIETNLKASCRNWKNSMHVLILILSSNKLAFRQVTEVKVVSTA